jgi:hypothetical protein
MMTVVLQHMTCCMSLVRDGLRFITCVMHLHDTCHAHPDASCALMPCGMKLAPALMHPDGLRRELHGLLASPAHAGDVPREAPHTPSSRPRSPSRRPASARFRPACIAVACVRRPHAVRRQEGRHHATQRNSCARRHHLSAARRAESAPRSWPSRPGRNVPLMPCERGEAAIGSRSGYAAGRWPVPAGGYSR